MCSNMTWCYGSSGLLGAWTSGAGHTQQAQLVGAAERNRPELLEYLAAYYSLVLMAITCCLNGPGGQSLKGPWRAGTAATGLSATANQSTPDTMHCKHLKKNSAQSLCKAGTSLRMLRYEPGLHVDGLEGCTFHCEAVLPQSKISATPNVPATGRAR